MKFIAIFEHTARDYENDEYAYEFSMSKNIDSIDKKPFVAMARDAGGMVNVEFKEDKIIVFVTDGGYEEESVTEWKDWLESKGIVCGDIDKTAIE